MKELLKLVKVEFQKLKRKKFILLVTLAAFMFPLPLAYLMTTPAMMEQYIDKADAFGVWNPIFITLYYRSSSCYVVFY